MILTTVGQLRSLIKDLPDEMTIIPEIGPDIQDVVLDYAETNIQFGAEQLAASVEARCDCVKRLYLSIDSDILTEDDEEELDDEDDDDDFLPY